MNWIEIIQYIAPLGAVVIWLIFLERKSERNATNITNIKENMEGHSRSIEKLTERMFVVSFPNAEKVNFPLTKEQYKYKNELLYKLRDKTITADEAEELRIFLEQEEKEQEKEQKNGADNWKALLGITAALVLINLYFKQKEIK